MHSFLISSFLALSASAAIIPRQANQTQTPPTGGSGCPPGLKGITFNGGYDVNQFDKIGGADDWISFGLDISGTPTSKGSQGHIPMMAFASHVAQAVQIVNSGSAPEWMLTFNEPDFSYAGITPTMSPEQAADAIKPLLQSPGPRTKFVAPVTADPNSDWLPNFYKACGCQSFFSAYNMHIYTPDIESVKSGLTSFHGKYGDKPIWLTEVAPGGASPACSVSWDAAASYMRQLYSWSKNSGFVDRVFWNSGNQIRGDDTNVCNSYLLDNANNPSPILSAYQGVDCT